MQDKLIARAKELLAEGKVQKVVGWKKGLFDCILNISGVPQRAAGERTLSCYRSPLYVRWNNYDKMRCMFQALQY